MNSNRQSAAKALQLSQQAQLKGDKRAARRYAEEAVRQAPDWEDPWLMLAALAEPKASVAYIEQALKINPQSEPARQAKLWAAARVKELPPQPKPQPAPFLAPLVSPTTPSPRHDRRADPAAVISRRVPISLMALFALCILVAFVAWSGGVSPVLASLGIAPTEAPLQIAGQSEVLKPTYTYTPTNTPTATPTFTPSPTPTNSPTPTETPLPTDTPLPTATPIPPPTFIPEQILLPTQPTAVVLNPQPVVGSGGERWVDVDLTNQMVYAYEGSQMINSFLVSTGTWEHPTVTGQYHIYTRLRYTDMAGPGYYLPDVPYTMYFYKGYALHGTYWHNNFGTPMSHGCVNLSIPDSEWLFNFASVGTLVNVHY
jgi:lipoprotein-anchoring transpeptidase ErfK/SrfK